MNDIILDHEIFLFLILLWWISHHSSAMLVVQVLLWVDIECISRRGKHKMIGEQGVTHVR